jgi:hypothetical protein
MTGLMRVAAIKSASVIVMVMVMTSLRRIVGAADHGESQGHKPV